MKAQLVDKYLEGNRRRHGLYLVGWFNCDQWDDEDSRKGWVSKQDINAVQESLDRRACQLSEEDLRVRSVVLDTALRYKERRAEDTSPVSLFSL